MLLGRAASLTPGHSSRRGTTGVDLALEQEKDQTDARQGARVGAF